ncbi:MAG: heavy metal translocating P-type ATPase [Sulfobacillus sp.]
MSVQATTMVPVGMQEDSFVVIGITDASAAARVKRTLEALAGVAQVTVNLASGRVQVVYARAEVSLDRLVQAVRQLNYQVALSETRLTVEGMTCASCVRRVERTLGKVPGVVSAEVNLASGTARISHLGGAVAEPALSAAVDKAGYHAQVIPAEDQDVEETARLRDLARWRRRFWWAAVPTLPLLLTMAAGWLGGWPVAVAWLANPWLLMGLATVVQVGPGSFFYRDAYLNLRGGTANMSVLVALGTTVAYVASALKLIGVLPAAFHGLYFETSALLVTLVLLGKLMEATGKGRASLAIRQLASLRPVLALRLEGDQERQVAVAEVRPGDLLRVGPGETLPVDGTVVQGQTEVDESMLTGESRPVPRRIGDAVACGTHNLTGSVVMRADRTGADTALAQIVRMVERAQAGKAPAERFADRVAAVFVVAVLAVAMVTAALWVLVGAPTEALVTAVAVLVVACPCALGLAIPTAIMVGTGRAAEQGMLFRNPEVLERAQRVNVVVFDKTGTLTEGRLGVADLRAHGVWEGQEQTLSELVAAVEERSEHPIGKALARRVPAGAAARHVIEDWWSQAGQGVRAVVDGQALAVGTAEFLASRAISISPDLQAMVDAEERLGQAVVLIGVASQAAGYAVLTDQLRPEAAAVVARLTQTGKEVWLLTGDNRATAQAVADQVSIPRNRVKAQVLPAAKAEMITELQASGRVVAMVGEGVNDAPALAVADLGIALGTGTDVARAAADVTLIGSDLQGVVAAFQMSQATVRKIHQNLAWALGYNIVGIPLAAFGLLNPAIAAAAMALSSVSVTTSALLLRRVRLATDRPAMRQP